MSALSSTFWKHYNLYQHCSRASHSFLFTMAGWIHCLPWFFTMGPNSSSTVWAELVHHQAELGLRDGAKLFVLRRRLSSGSAVGPNSASSVARPNTVCAVAVWPNTSSSDMGMGPNLASAVGPSAELCVRRQTELIVHRDPRGRAHRIEHNVPAEGPGEQKKWYGILMKEEILYLIAISHPFNFTLIWHCIWQGKTLQTITSECKVLRNINSCYMAEVTFVKDGWVA